MQVKSQTWAQIWGTYLNIAVHELCILLLYIPLNTTYSWLVLKGQISLFMQREIQPIPTLLTFEYVLHIIQNITLNEKTFKVFDPFLNRRVVVQ